jgi:hypothetical protein
MAGNPYRINMDSPLGIITSLTEARAQDAVIPLVKFHSWHTLPKLFAADETDFQHILTLIPAVRIVSVRFSLRRNSAIRTIDASTSCVRRLEV